MTDQIQVLYIDDDLIILHIAEQFPKLSSEYIIIFFIGKGGGKVVIEALNSGADFSLLKISHTQQAGNFRSIQVKER